MRRIGFTGQALAATIGLSAALVGFVTDRIVGIPSGTQSPDGLQEARAALYDHATAATIGGCAKVVAAVGLLVAIGSFCHRIAAPLHDGAVHDSPWTGPVAVVCVAGWAATQAVSAASRGALVRFDLSVEGHEDLLRLVLGFAEYVNALGLVLLCAGAVLVAATVPTRRFGGWEDNVRATAVLVGFVAGAAAAASAVYLPKADRTFETNAFRPGNPIHGAVTFAWFVLLLCLAIDGLLRTDDAR